MSLQLSQAEVSRLSEQEQDAYARVILDASRNRRAKLQKAKGYPGRYLITGILLLSFVGATFFSQILSMEVFVGFFVVVLLMQWHVAGLNKRMDALMDLLELKEEVANSHSRKPDESSEGTIR